MQPTFLAAPFRWGLVEDYDNDAVEIIESPGTSTING